MSANVQMPFAKLSHIKSNSLCVVRLPSVQPCAHCKGRHLNHFLGAIPFSSAACRTACLPVNIGVAALARMFA